MFCCYTENMFYRKDEKESCGLIFPGGDTAFKALLSARSCAAIWSHITDCDETYNYWEPLHYLGLYLVFLNKFMTDFQQVYD